LFTCARAYRWAAVSQARGIMPSLIVRFEILDVRFETNSPATPSFSLGYLIFF